MLVDGSLASTFFPWQSKMLLIALILTFIPLFIGSRATSVSPRIIGGKDTDIIDHPYMVSIRYHQKYACGGVIISSKHVLTGAQCIQNNTESLRYCSIFTGSKHSTGPGSVKYGVKKVDIHEGFVGVTNYYRYDVAVLTLTRDIEFNAGAQKITISSRPAKSNDNGTLIGWGLDHDPALGMAPAFTLQKANMTVLTKDWCEELHPRESQIQEGQFCAFHKAKVSACPGDSGSPLVVANEVVGFVSWNWGCGVGIPDVYTDIYFYRDWIKQKAGINGAPSVVNSAIILISCVFVLISLH